VCDEKLPVAVRSALVYVVQENRSMRDRRVIEIVLHGYLQVRCLYSTAKEKDAEHAKKETIFIPIHAKISPPARI
jgi:hypothetical protein